MDIDPTERRHEIGNAKRMGGYMIIGAFNQEKAVVEAFSVIVKSWRTIG